MRVHTLTVTDMYTGATELLTASISEAKTLGEAVIHAQNTTRSAWKEYNLQTFEDMKVVSTDTYRITQSRALKRITHE